MSNELKSFQIKPRKRYDGYAAIIYLGDVVIYESASYEKCEDAEKHAENLLNRSLAKLLEGK